MILSAVLSLTLQSGGSAPAAHPLDLFMRDVTEACLLPDLKRSDPHAYFVAHGWARKDRNGRFAKRIGDADYVVRVIWPATKKEPAGCSFETNDVTAYDTYDWFRKRIGEPEGIAWDEQQVGGWNMTTNGHGAGVYVSRRRPNNSERAGMMLHILQN